ncbi:PAH-inducible cytochrome P450 monooxygenase PC-PAH 1 [Obba rivulosa]|uniref:PAH-inducible cytochrome P450 monooxygenase PC-PAH 1 n=1 Tax=Obba rivulosa TaxID=1052685 RepID=A0A8E2DKU5_9APHY|nr:PAH-inducible cytochrome P450 monooxygenase PC-PAH 1 [Obba rivulosa]
MDNVLVAYLLFAIFAVFTTHRYVKRRFVGHIRGPAAPSWLFGHSISMGYQDQVGDHDFPWIKEYGTVWRTKGCWGQDILYVADPKALQHIFHKSGYHYPKSIEARQLTRQLAGEGILFAEGVDHARNRKIMNPAFTAAQLRTFVPLFRRSAVKLSGKWKDQLRSATSESERTVNVISWLARTTMDVIGEAAFDYQCGALDDAKNEVMEAYRNMFSDSFLFPPKATILFRSFWKFIPPRILRFVEYLPTRESIRFRRTLRVVSRLSAKLIAEKTEACLAGKAENKRDIMSILVKANASEDPRTRLSNTEMTSQMASFLLAGHDTTASSLTWLFWELAKHPEWQDKLREEIAAIRDRVTARGDTDFSVADYDAMSNVVAAMKETMRLHPIVHTLARVAGREDVIPLSQPVTSTTGEIVTEIPVSDGQDILISVCGYNRLKEVWGEDADEFNPSRFLQTKEGQLTVGVFANIMSFSGGLRGCIGWRFAILEMQAILVELLENFEFSIPDDKPEIQRVPAGLMVPMIRNKMHLGTQMPLKISVVGGLA